MENRFETFVSSVNSIYRSIQKIKSKEMTELGLRGPDVMCLFQLGRHADGLTSAELSALCCEDKAAVSRAVSRLEDAKFITFGAAPYKKRYRCKILLTEEGQKAAESVYNAVKTAVTAGGEGLTDDERAVFYKALSIIEKNLNELY